MQPNVQIMNLETNTYPKEFYATHIVEKKEGELVSRDAPASQGLTIGNRWRIVQWWQGDNTSPDALNGIFSEKLRSLLESPYRNEDPSDINQMKGRLEHLIENARVFEEVKKEIFSNAWASPVMLPSLSDLIQQAEMRKQQLEADLVGSPKKESPRKQQLQNLEQSLALAWTYLFNREPKQLDEVFRLAGEGNRVATLTSHFTQLPPDALKVEFSKENSPHNIATAMKRAISQLDPPLVPNDKYPFFLAADKETDRAKKIAILKSAIRGLPPENQAILKMALANLRELAKTHAEHRMSALNLTVVWGPTLLRIPKDVPPENFLQETAAANNIVKFLIDNDVF